MIWLFTNVQEEHKYVEAILLPIPENLAGFLYIIIIAPSKKQSRENVWECLVIGKKMRRIALSAKL